MVIGDRSSDCVREAVDELTNLRDKMSGCRTKDIGRRVDGKVDSLAECVI